MPDWGLFYINLKHLKEVHDAGIPAIRCITVDQENFGPH